MKETQEGGQNPSPSSTQSQRNALAAKKRGGRVERKKGACSEGKGTAHSSLPRKKKKRSLGFILSLGSRRFQGGREHEGEDDAKETLIGSAADRSLRRKKEGPAHVYPGS